MSAAAAPAPSLQLRSAHPRAGGRGTQPAPLGSRSQSHARCSALSDPEGQGQRAVYPPSPPRPPAAAAAGPQARSPRTPSSRGRGAAGGGAQRSRGGRRRRGSASDAGRAGWDASAPASLCPFPITLPVGFLSPSPPPPPTGSWAAQRKPIRGRQLRPALAKQPPGRDEERTRLGIGDEAGSQLVEILLGWSLALRFRSASRALPPLRRRAARGARHCGSCSPRKQKRRHVP